MTTLDASSTLFQTDLEAPLIEYPGCRFDLRWPRLFGVHGSIGITQPNPKGRTVCSVSVKLRRFWTDDELRAAIRVAAHWFRDIGGMGMLQAKQIGHVIARIKKRTEEQSMHWAIDAYANAKWHRDSKQWTTLGRFFKGEFYGQWLEESPEFKALVERNQKAADQARRVAARQSRGTPVRELDDATLAAHYLMAKRYGEAFDAARAKAERKSFTMLDTQGRRALIRKAQLERSGCWDNDTMGLMGMDNGNFSPYVYTRALYQRAIQAGKPMESLITVRVPKAPCDHGYIYQEVNHRAGVDCCRVDDQRSSKIEAWIKAVQEGTP